jgi:hypothetical protein
MAKKKGTVKREFKCYKCQEIFVEETQIPRGEYVQKVLVQSIGICKACTAEIVKG